VWFASLRHVAEHLDELVSLQRAGRNVYGDARAKLHADI
jgi:hypothetical protein